MGAHVPSSHDSAARPRVQQIARVALYAALLLLALWVIRDFIPAIAWACVIAIAMWPLLKRFESHRLFRSRPTLIATVITAAISLLVVLSVAVATTQAFAQAHDLREWLHTVQDNGIPLPDVVSRLPYGAAQITEWWQANLGHPLHAATAMHGVNGEKFIAFGRQFGTKLAHVLLEFGFMLVTLFVILRAGHKLSGALLQGARRAFGRNGAELIERMVAAVYGTVTGLVVVGLGEGALLGVAYALAGVPHAALLGLVTAVAAMLPFCAPVVFCGAALWLFVQGGDHVGRRGRGARVHRRVRRRAFRAAGADRRFDTAAVPARAVRHPRRRRDVRPDRAVRRPGADDGAHDAVGRMDRLSAHAAAPVRRRAATARRAAHAKAGCNDR